MNTTVEQPSTLLETFNQYLHYDIVEVEKFDINKDYYFPNVKGDLIEDVAKHFELLVLTTSTGNNLAVLNVGNGYVYFETNKFNRHIFRFKALYKAPFNVNIIFEHDLNNMFKFNVKSFQRYVDFYNNAFNELEKAANSYNQKLEEIKLELKSLGAVVCSYDINTDYIKFGDLRNIYYKIHSDITKNGNTFEVKVYYSQRDNQHNFVKSDKFFKALENGKVLSILDFNSQEDRHERSMACYTMLRDIIATLKGNKMIEDNHEIKLGKDVYTLNADGFTNDVLENGEYLSIDNLDIRTMLKLRRELLKLF